MKALGSCVCRSCSFVIRSPTRQIPSLTFQTRLVRSVEIETPDGRARCFSPRPFLAGLGNPTDHATSGLSAGLTSIVYHACRALVDRHKTQCTRAGRWRSATQQTLADPPAAVQWHTGAIARLCRWLCLARAPQSLRAESVASKVPCEVHTLMKRGPRISVPHFHDASGTILCAS